MLPLVCFFWKMIFLLSIQTVMYQAPYIQWPSSCSLISLTDSTEHLLISLYELLFHSNLILSPVHTLYQNCNTQSDFLIIVLGQRLLIILELELTFINNRTIEGWENNNNVEACVNIYKDELINEQACCSKSEKRI